MRIAVLGDIHGNLDALDAVLADVTRRGFDDMVILGDHVSGPLDPARTTDRLMCLPAMAIRGNHDRWVLETPLDKMGPSDRHAREELEQVHLTWLGALPATAVVHGALHLCHGTPSSDTACWMEEVLPDGRARMAPRAAIERHAEGLAYPVLLCGHTHIPRIVHLADGQLLLNPGSVGLPGYDDDTPPHIMETGSPAAVYALIEHRGGHWHPSLHWVGYDATRVSRLAASRARPEWARVLASGWMTP